MGNKIERREFLALMGLGGAAAATVGCGPQRDYFEERWHSWTDPVPQTIPYEPRYYSTTVGECSYRVTTIGGRVTKLDGNPDDPMNQGKLTAAQQSIIQGLYSGDRLKRPMLDGRETTWREIGEYLTAEMAKIKGGEIRTLTGPMTGAVEKIWTQFIAEMGNGWAARYAPFSSSDLVIASEKVFGQAAQPLFSLAGSDYVLSLGACFLGTWGDVTLHSRDYSEIRTVQDGKRAKHVQVQAKMTLSGASADKVLKAKPGSETILLLAILKQVGEMGSSVPADVKAKITEVTGNVTLAQAAQVSGLKEEKITHVVDELIHAESAVVLPADRLSLGDQAVAHNAAMLLLNKALGGIGKHVNYSAAKPVERVPGHGEILRLIEEMNSGNVGLLLIKDANPVYGLPAAAGFEEALAKVPLSIAFAHSTNETVAKAKVVLPVTHPFESWGEVNTYAGIDMLTQPVMTPRWTVKQAEDHLIDWLNASRQPATTEGAEGDTASGAAAGAAATDTAAEATPAVALIEGGFQAYLKTDWVARFGGDDKAWRDALRKGGRFEVAESGDDLAISGNLTTEVFSTVADATVGSGPALVIVPCARLGDGSNANSGWMQELPDAMTGVTWDSWLEIGTAYAEENSLRNGDVVKLEANGQSVELPVFIVETCSAHAMALATGQGRTDIGERFRRGVNAFTFLSAELNDGDQITAAPMTPSISKTGRREKMATFHIPGKGDRLNTKLSLFDEKDPNYTRHLWKYIGISSLSGHDDGHGGDHGGHGKGPPKESRFPKHTDKNFYPDRSDTPITLGRPETFYDAFKWEMAIDLNKCTGCGSCVTACYAENNIPVVGKDQVVKGREMAWMRINRYLDFTEKDGDEKITVGMLPMMCQQCGNAPCESVCPSYATYHNPEGLNAMVYNRCVGTRYCSNNCSYKVRRFNWFTFEFDGDQNWQLNPNVTVRTKGVMEKCTFCSHRLRDAKDKAKDDGRTVADGDVMTACQQACPSHAITFGNYSDDQSQVHAAAHDKRAYRALDDHLHTLPGVSYLKRVKLDSDEEHHG